MPKLRYNCDDHILIPTICISAVYNSPLLNFNLNRLKYHRMARSANKTTNMMQFLDSPRCPISFSGIDFKNSDIQLYQLTLSDENQKAYRPRPQGSIGSSKLFITAVKVCDGKLVIERKRIVNICFRVKCGEYPLATRQFWKKSCRGNAGRKMGPLPANLFPSHGHQIN